MTDVGPVPTSDLQLAEEQVAARKYDEALALLRRYWLENPKDLKAIRLMSRIMKALGKTELSGSLYNLAESEQALEQDLPNLFQSGYKLIDEHELQLAVMLLQRCADKAPDDSTVAYELAFAMMSLHRFAEAIPYFQRAGDDFDTMLNLCVCYTLVRDVQNAEAIFAKVEKLAKSDDEKAEVKHRRVVLKRLQRFAKKTELTRRDWLFILYGTVLLSEGSSNTPDYDAVAWTLLVLEKLLTELGHEFDVIEFYSPLSRPLAEALAHKLDLPAKSFGGENSTDRALMMMAWAPNIIGPHKSFFRNSKKRVLFAYGLGVVQPLPLTPDLVGEICDSCQMPWAESCDEETDEPLTPGTLDLPDSVQANATDMILAAIARMESRPEIIQTVQILWDYYKPKVDQLVVGNPEQFKERPEYTAEVV